MRGWSLRKNLKGVLCLRIKQHRSQMLQLWRISYTPLAYRSQFWMWATQWGECNSLFIQKVIYEEELENLWLNAKLGDDDKIDSSKNKIDDIVIENKVNRTDRLTNLVKMMNNSFYWRFLQVRMISKINPSGIY